MLTKLEQEMLKEPLKKVRWLTDEERYSIILDRKKNMKIKDIAKKYNITAKTVHNVINRFNDELMKEKE